MGIHLVVAVTDEDWFRMLSRASNLKEVNFWSPSDSNFKALIPGEMFLFKLRYPHNAIVGGGIFTHANSLPCSLAWEAFGEANGATSEHEMRTRIAKYRRVKPEERSDFAIGCRILSQPFFFAEQDWIPIPKNWSKNIVQFKTYHTDDFEGRSLWNAVAYRLKRENTHQNIDSDRYGKPTRVKPRLGQGGFRILITDTYKRRCAITQERTLPALEAAHIRPYSEGGPHEISNGLLLRRDIHSLFDAGYVTITPNLNFEVSRKIREEFQNGRHYYELHGQKIMAPLNPSERPDAEALRWHNEKCFKG